MEYVWFIVNNLFEIDDYESFFVLYISYGGRLIIDIEGYVFFCDFLVSFIYKSEKDFLDIEF